MIGSNLGKMNTARRDREVSETSRNFHRTLWIPIAFAPGAG
jgi:hypothetical protein